MKWADHPAAAWVLAAVAFGCAAIGARPYAGGWNDGSRLATVESLVERRTLTIDDSIFVTPPADLVARGMPPFAPGSVGSLTGTLDRLFVGGHFYSDKPAVISLLMAAAYEPCRWLGAPLASERPDVFCYLLTLLFAGGSFAATVGCLWVVGSRVGLPPGLRLAWLAAFAFGTFALAYTRHVNNHIMQLAVVAGMCAVFVRAPGALRVGSAAALGTLAGLGFNLDFGSGPPLVAIVGCYLIWRERRAAPVLAYALAALPWVGAGLWINYAIGGVLQPMNMVPEYSQWPGSPFDARNLTGFVRYGPVDQARYLYCMLFGSPGFFVHNLPLFLALAAAAGTLRKPFAGRDALVALLVWCVATWLNYGFLSNNYSGKNVSVRWFVPFLAPGFWLLAAALRSRPELKPQFAVLGAFGAVLGGLMWWVGPWAMQMVPLLWPVAGSALGAWGAVAWRTRRRPETVAVGAAPPAARRAA